MFRDWKAEPLIGPVVKHPLQDVNLSVFCMLRLRPYRSHLSWGMYSFAALTMLALRQSSQRGPHIFWGLQHVQLSSSFPTRKQQQYPYTLSELGRRTTKVVSNWPPETGRKCWSIQRKAPCPGGGRLSLFCKAWASGKFSAIPAVKKSPSAHDHGTGSDCHGRRHDKSGLHALCIPGLCLFENPTDKTASWISVNCPASPFNNDQNHFKSHQSPNGS